ncbi:MAG: YceI family protein [Anaerolineae bacterium]|nr:YceI family protein [Anaerolineae bacterium]NUQ05357.1 YceI family protein [Anaerolineae bacterium]
MNRTGRIVLGLIAAVAVLAVVIFAYVYISGGSGEASRAVESASVSAASSATVFEIMQDESEVRFILDEDLRGIRTTVTGRTNEVAGQVAVDFAAPANTELGAISINVRTLTTDNEFRNRALRGQILLSQQDEFEFASFAPTSVEGLPALVTMGEPFSFTINGDLTVKGITKPVTFNAMVMPESETRISGTASALVQRADYELTIPSVPGVANVEEEVQLEIDFVAVAIAG